MEAVIGQASASAGESPLFMGRKQRRFTFFFGLHLLIVGYLRRSSDVKPFVGDQFHMQENKDFVKAMSKTGDKTVIFSDEVLIVNKKFC